MYVFVYCHFWGIFDPVLSKLNYKKMLKFLVVLLFFSNFAPEN